MFEYRVCQSRLNNNVYILFLGNSPTIAKKHLRPMQEVELKCDGGKQILIKKVRHWPEKNEECCPANTLKKISSICNGKQSCDIILDKSIIKAGCVATMKKTSVKYWCVSKMPDVSFRKMIGCRKKSKNII